MPDTLVDLIRHGEPVGGKRYRGSGRGIGQGDGRGSGTDDPLSPLGRTQMRRALGECAPWQQLISSPLARCREMAVELAARHGLPLAVEPDLREIGMGVWEGRTHEDVLERDALVYRAVQTDPMGHRPAHGEPLADFLARVSCAYERQVAAYPGRHLLILCHGAVMRALVGHLLLAEPTRWWRLHIDFAHIVRVRHGRLGPALECVNAARIPDPAALERERRE